MELLLRPPTTAISVLKFCNSSSFCQRRRRKHQARGQKNALVTAKGNFRDCEKRGGGVKVKKYLQKNKLRWIKEGGKNPKAQPEESPGAVFNNQHLHSKSNLSAPSLALDVPTCAVSNCSALFVNGNPQGSALPFSLCSVSLKINGFAAVWEGRRGGSFDSAQTPFAGKRQKRRAGQSLDFKSRLLQRQSAGCDRRQSLREAPPCHRTAQNNMQVRTWGGSR